MRLKNLSSLTHEKINTAYINALLRYPDSIPRSFIDTKCPFQRTMEIIRPFFTKENCADIGRQFSPLPDEIYLYFLCELLGSGQESIGTLLAYNQDYLRAALIFLKFRAEGKNYLAVNGNTCLHDAMDCRKNMNNLLPLLIESGADPEQENDDHLSALAMYFQRHDRKDRLLNSRENPPAQKIIQYIAKRMIKGDQRSLTLLKRAADHQFFKRHPGLINFNCQEFLGITSYLLHVAIDHSVELVEFMLLNAAANPHLCDDENMRPVDRAASKLMSKKLDYQPDSVEKYLTIISHLLYSMTRSSKLLLTDELLKLDMINEYRVGVCWKIFQLYPQAFPKDHQKALLQTLEEKLVLIKHPEIVLESKKGSGTYGMVFHATWGTQPVAVKLAQKTMGEYDLRQEAEIHARFKHPNIINFMGTIERSNRFGIVMEYANCDLARFIDRYYTEDCFYPYAKQMNAGLKYLHQLGLVHLDFKSPNVLIIDYRQGAGAEVKICDFGATSHAGTPALFMLTSTTYCSPEIFESTEPYQVSNDTFSYGVVLGEMDSQGLPWEELEKDIEAQADASNCDPRELAIGIIREHVCSGKRTNFNNKSLTPKVAHLVNWCWQQKPENRPNEDQIEEYLDTWLSI